MRPVHRNRRLLIVTVSTLAVLAGAFLLLTALQDNKQFFKHPSDLVHPTYVKSPRDIRVGGIVVADSIVKLDGLEVEFKMTDFTPVEGEDICIVVAYDKVLPDLFREGQGVVVTGQVNENGVFIANNVLAKHDENYIPKMPDKVGYGDKS